MLCRSFVLGSVALACLTATGAGQSMSPLRLGVALGTSFGANEWWWPDGSHAVLSVTRHRTGSRFGLRVEAIYSNYDHWERLEPGVTFAGREDVVLWTINTIYRLAGQPTGLYALLGVGVYKRWSELRIDGIQQEVRRATESGLDANIGLGFDFKAFGSDMFVEARMSGQSFDTRIPLSLGVRF
jgi:hypothetical protein